MNGLEVVVHVDLIEQESTPVQFGGALTEHAILDVQVPHDTAMVLAVGLDVELPPTIHSQSFHVLSEGDIIVPENRCCVFQVLLLGLQLLLNGAIEPYRQVLMR